jgi:tight adherence protein B
MRRIVAAVFGTLLLAMPAPALAASAQVQIRHVSLAKYPSVSVTALAPPGATPTLFEDGRPAPFATARELGSAQALMLAVDNSESMQGYPLAEAKQAAAEFLGAERAVASGLVAFGHDAVPLTRTNASKADVAATLAALVADTQSGTSLYDAVALSAARLQRMPAAARVLVLLTDGHDVGSHKSLATVTAAAQRANIVIYAIAVGRRANPAPLRALASATGGRVFDSKDVSNLSSTYETLGRELDRTWQISFLASARPGDRMTLTANAAGGTSSAVRVSIPGTQSRGLGLLPAGFAKAILTAVIVAMVAGLLLGGALARAIRARRRSEISRVLQRHLEQEKAVDASARRRRSYDAVVDWAEGSLADLPGTSWLSRAVESSGLPLRTGHVPLIGTFGAIFLAVVATIAGAGPLEAMVLLLVGFALPLPVLWEAARRRRNAFDRQLPDVLATVASTLRAGHGLRIAFRAVADEGSPPASHEFRRVLGEEGLGRPLDEAIAAMCERIKSDDFTYVATAINVQSQTGGSLATLFDTLSETVRERQRHDRKVRALTSMGRMSATILICLPFGLTALMTAISPRYMKPLFTTSTGHGLIVFSLVSLTIGALFLKRLVNVRY